MDIRDTYYSMTGDYEGAYGRNNDDRGDYIYSDDSLIQAIDAISGTQNLGEREAISGAIQNFGPRAGSVLGLGAAEGSPQAGYWGVENSLSDIVNAKAADDYSGRTMDMIKGAGGILSELTKISPARRMGAKYGLLEYLANKITGNQ